MSLPYTIRTSRLLLRCYQPTPSDATMLKTAVDESLEHLLPWMPWAHLEPQTIEEKIALLRHFRGQFDLDQSYAYGVYNLDGTSQLGGIGAHWRAGKGAIEIGYWVRMSSVRQGIMREAASALVRAIFAYLPEVDRIDIHCNPENVASAAVARTLGFTHEGTLRQRPLPTVPGVPATVADTMAWSLLRRELVGSPAAATEIRCADVADREIRH